jgi:hypothetical protein
MVKRPVRRELEGLDLSLSRAGVHDSESVCLSFVNVRFCKSVPFGHLLGLSARLHSIPLEIGWESRVHKDMHLGKASQMDSQPATDLPCSV